MRDSKIYIKILINLLMLILAAFAILYVLPKLIGFFMPFVIGWIVAMIANPMVKFLENKVSILRKHSSAIIIVVVISIIAGGIYLLIALLFKEIDGLISNLQNIMDQLGKQFEEVSDWLRSVSKGLPDNIQNTIENLILSISEAITNFVKNIDPPSISEAGIIAKVIAEGFLMVIITILSAYFFIARRDELINGIRKNMPEPVTNGWKLISDNFKTAVGGYFKAQFKIMLVLTIVMFVGFEILRVDYSFLLALGIAFLDFLPVFGTGAILWPWAVVSMISGNYFMAVGLIVIYLICQILKQVLQPKMVGDSIGISPLATLIFMFIGYKFYGVLGMILGIPIGMVLINLYRIGMFDRIIRGFKIIIHDINEFRKF